MRRADADKQNRRQDVGTITATAQAEIDGDRDGDCRQQLGEYGGFEQRVEVRDADPMAGDDSARRR